MWISEKDRMKIGNGGIKKKKLKLENVLQN